MWHAVRQSILTDGRCIACSTLGDTQAESIPEGIKSGFRKVKAGSNQAYMVILGKKLLGRNKVIVYNRQANEEIGRHSAGMFNQLTGGYK